MAVGEITASAQQAQARGGSESRDGRQGAAGPGVLQKGGDESDTDLSRALAGDSLADEIASPNELRLKVDRDLDQIVATVVDPKSERVIRTIPPEELLAAAKRLEVALGQILNREV